MTAGDAGPPKGSVPDETKDPMAPAKPKEVEPRFGESLFRKSVRKFKRDRLGMWSLGVVGFYAIIALCVKIGLFATLDASTTPVGPAHRAPGTTYEWTAPSGETRTRTTWFGTDIRGNDVGRKLVYSIKQAFAIGILVAFFSVLIGVVLGSISGYFGGKIDDFLLWVYTSMSSVPYILWIIAISYAFGKGFGGVVIALSCTFWVGVYFNIRAEVRRLKEMEFVLASESFGMGRMHIIFGDILPNLTHLISIFLSLNFIAAIKNEVPSWGAMISSARLDLLAGKWWEVTGATILLFILVMAFNLFTDSLQDAFDPKKVG
jgi:peptide/nickel transport system permease protein